VAGLGAAAIFGLMAESADGDLEPLAEGCKPNCTSPEIRDLESRRDTYATVANVSLAVGAAGVVTAGVLWLVASRSRARAPRERSAGARLQLRAAPPRFGLRVAF
jgi:hypothetical protein